MFVLEEQELTQHQSFISTLIALIDTGITTEQLREHLVRLLLDKKEEIADQPTKRNQ